VVNIIYKDYVINKAKNFIEDLNGKIRLTGVEMNWKNKRVSIDGWFLEQYCFLIVGTLLSGLGTLVYSLATKVFVLQWETTIIYVNYSFPNDLLW